MRLNLDALYVLDAIARNGSFAAAANELNRVPSAITYAVQKLEQDLGVRLFDRRGHRAVLTPAGQELLREGRQLLRAAGDLEARVKRVASGWEAELCIAVDHLIGVERLYPLCAEFYEEGHGTRLHLAEEVSGGCWDALASGRAALAVGAPAEGLAGGGYATHPLGSVELAFAVAPQHPLATAREPLTREDILSHRVIAAADSSRTPMPRAADPLSRQPVLTVPDMRAKLEAHRQGLGVGYIPRRIAEQEAADGRLVIKRVEDGEPPAELSLAWRTTHKGRALHWFLSRLTTPEVTSHLLT